MEVNSSHHQGTKRRHGVGGGACRPVHVDPEPRVGHTCSCAARAVPLPAIRAQRDDLQSVSFIEPEIGRSPQRSSRTEQAR
jgi:hypothetical protein